MDGELDSIWKALSDPTRRRLLDLLRTQARTTGELTEAIPNLTRYAVMKHLGVLEAAGLVVVRREGRKRWNHLNAVPLRRIYDHWVSRYADQWAGSLVGLKAVVEGSVEQRTMAAIEHETTINATAARVYQLLVASRPSWLAHDPVSGDPDRGLTLEARVGGRLLAGDEQDGVLLAFVASMHPERELVLAGLFGDPTAVSQVARLTLERCDDGVCVRVVHEWGGSAVTSEREGRAAWWANGLEALKRLSEETPNEEK